MRAILFLCCVAIAVSFATMTPSRGETEAEFGDDSDDTTEPITGDPVMPLKGSETPMKDPFKPYDIGDPQAAWKYEDLTAAEKVVADRGLDEDQSAVQENFAAAARGLAEHARAESAAAHLGVEDLAAIGGAP